MTPRTKAPNGEQLQEALSGELGAYEKAGLYQKVKEAAQRAVALLSAPQVKGGEYTVVLDPVLARASRCNRHLTGASLSRVLQTRLALAGVTSI